MPFNIKNSSRVRLIFAINTFVILLFVLVTIFLAPYFSSKKYFEAMSMVDSINHGAKGGLTLWHTIDNPFGDGIIVFNQQYGNIIFIVLDDEVFAVSEEAYEASGEVEFYNRISIEELMPYLDDQGYCISTHSCKSRNGVAL